jgi:hypothetical protein
MGLLSRDPSKKKTLNYPFLYAIAYHAVRKTVTQSLSQFMNLNARNSGILDILDILLKFLSQKGGMLTRSI